MDNERCKAAFDSFKDISLAEFMAFVNQMNKITGVKNATLVSYNGVYMS